MVKFLDSRLLNVLQLGLGFSIIFTTVQIAIHIQETVINTYHNLTGTIDPKAGYYGLAISSMANIVFNFISAPMVELITGKWAMVLGGLGVVLYLASFLKLSTAFLFFVSVIFGLKTTLLWVGLGQYLTNNSDEETVKRNSVILWVTFQGGLPIGGIILYTQFRNVEILSLETINVVFISLLVIASVGVAILALLRQSRKTPVKMDVVTEAMVPGESTTQRDNLQVDPVSSGKSAKKEKSASRALKAGFKNWWSNFIATFKLLKSVQMLLLVIVFIFTGLQLAFLAGIYGTCLSFTRAFGGQAKALLAINIIFVGLGEIFAGGICEIFNQKLHKSIVRSAIVFLGLCVHLVAFLLIFLNIPLQAPLGVTSDAAYINSNKYLAIFCGFLLGFADSCWTTQIYSFLGAFYAKQSASAFSLYNFFQNIGAGVALVYCAYLNLGWQLLILVCTSLLGAFAFAKVNYDRSRVINNHET